MRKTRGKVRPGKMIANIRKRISLSSILPKVRASLLRLAEAFRPAHRLALLTLLALGLYLRLYGLDLAPLSAAEADLLVGAAELARGDSWALVGPPTALGLQEPPFALYLLALPVAISRDPLLAISAVVTIHVAALAGLFLMVHKYLGLRVATLAGLLWAASPGAVSLAREISPLALAMPLVIPFIWGLLLAVVDRHPWGWTLAAASAGLAIAISLSSLLLLPMLLVAIILYPKRVAWEHLALGICVASLMLSPYLYAQNLERFAGLSAAARSWMQGLAQGVRPWMAVNTLRGAVGEPLPKPAAPQEILPIIFSPLQVVLGWLGILGILAPWPLGLRAWARWKERRSPDRYVVMGAVGLTGILALACSSVAPEAEHTLALQLVAFVGLAALADHLAPRKPRGAKAILISLVLGIVALGLVTCQGYANLAWRRYEAHHDPPAEDGLPYRFWREAAGLARQGARTAGLAEVWLGFAEAPDTRPLLFLLEDKPRVLPLGPGATLLPAGRPGLYLQVGQVAATDRDLLPAADLEQVGRFLSPGGGYEASLTLAQGQEPEEILGAIQNLMVAGLGDGLYLLGYDGPREADGQVRLDTYWVFVDVPQEASAKTHCLAVEVVDGEGHAIARAEGLGIPKEAWAEGYLVRQTHLLQIPEEPWQVRVSLAEGECPGESEMGSILLQPTPLPPA